MISWWRSPWPSGGLMRRTGEIQQAFAGLPDNVQGAVYREMGRDETVDAISRLAERMAAMSDDLPLTI